MLTGRAFERGGEVIDANTELLALGSAPWIPGFPATKLATVGLVNSSEVSGVPPPVPGIPKVVQVCPRLAER